MFGLSEAIQQKLGRIMESRLIAHIHTMAVIGQARFNIAAERAVELVDIKQLVENKFELVENKFIMVASTIVSTQESIEWFEILLKLDFKLIAKLADFVECTESKWFEELIEQSSMIAIR